MESLSGLQIGCARNVAAPELNLCGADYGLAGLVSCSAVGTWIYAVSRARCRSSLTAFLGTEPDLINTLNPSWLCTDPSWESLVARLLYQKGLHMGCAEKQVAPQRDREIVALGRVPLCWALDKSCRILQVSEPCILSEDGLVTSGLVPPEHWLGFGVVLMPEALETVLERRERCGASPGPSGLRRRRS